jgi:hypothetical protein
MHLNNDMSKVAFSIRTYETRVSAYKIFGIPLFKFPPGLNSYGVFINFSRHVNAPPQNMESPPHDNQLPKFVVSQRFGKTRQFLENPAAIFPIIALNTYLKENFSADVDCGFYNTLINFHRDYYLPIHLLFTEET